MTADESIVNVRELTRKKSIRYGLAGFLASFAVFGLWQVAKPVVHEFDSSFAMREFKANGVIGTYKKHFFSFIDKLDEMRSLDLENQALGRKIALLEQEIVLNRVEHVEHEASRTTASVSERLQRKAGSELARVLKSISYHAPENLLPNQLYALGIEYFRKQEYEQAAVIFSQLIDLREDTSYQRSETQLMCAIAWYHLKQFKLADHYLAQTKEKSEPSDAIYRTALVWEALAAKASGQTEKSQQRVIQIISRYPHSKEASWLNRAPASFDGHEFPGFERFQEQQKSEDAHPSENIEKPQGNQPPVQGPTHANSEESEPHEG